MWWKFPEQCVISHSNCSFIKLNVVLMNWVDQKLFYHQNPGPEKSICRFILLLHVLDVFRLNFLNFQTKNSFRPMIFVTALPYTVISYTKHPSRGSWVILFLVIPIIAKYQQFNSQLEGDVNFFPRYLPTHSWISVQIFLNIGNYMLGPWICH